MTDKVNTGTEDRRSEIIKERYCSTKGQNELKMERNVKSKLIVDNAERKQT